jgi:UDP-3-O-[3-hydroxymyristoyl] glucosamine N-acyltransferase
MIKISRLVEFFKERGLNVLQEASSDIAIKNGRNISEAGEGEITFLGAKYKDKARELFSASKASLMIVDKEIYDAVKDIRSNSVLVIADNPKETMVDCLSEFFLKKVVPGVHPSAVIDASVRIGADNYVGPHCIIEENVVIGDNCVIEGNVMIRKDTVIGNNVLLKAGAVIGGQGFGYVKKGKEWTNFPHFGNVVIEDNVEVGSNTCIDRGALGSTLIKRGAKIDNLVHIAHNVVVGENSLIIADAMIGGSTVIGDDTWVAPSTAIRNGLTIGANCVVGMGAVVIKNVEDGTTVVGNPAVPFTKGKKS